MRELTMTDLRILIYRDDELFVGQCLEHDICVQSRDLDDIRRLMGHQVEFHEGQGGLSKVPPAPPEFEKAWNETKGDPRPIMLDGNGQAQAKLAA
jgi:hypothetical protein